ncbi:unnamed protein product, partial [Durusdinium trenchii]
AVIYRGRWKITDRLLKFNCEKLERGEELNHAAHAAKQDGLGIDDPEQAVQKKDEDQDWLR